MRLPSILKKTTERLLPARVYGSLRASAGRRLANRWLEESGVFELALKVAETFHYEVQAGPFKAMKYTQSAVLSRHATPALLGQYERQIQNEPFVQRFSRSHNVEVIGHPDSPGGVDLLAFLGEEALRMATEYRPFQQWIIARPKTSSAMPDPEESRGQEASRGRSAETFAL